MDLMSRDCTRRIPQQPCGRNFLPPKRIASDRFCQSPGSPIRVGCSNMPSGFMSSSHVAGQDCQHKFASFGTCVNPLRLFA